MALRRAPSPLAFIAAEAHSLRVYRTAPQGERRLGPGFGLLSMLLASLVFTVMSSAVKVARAELGPFELIMWRGIIASPLLALMTLRHGFRVQGKGPLVARALLGFIAMSSFFFSLKTLPVADFSIINRLHPILVGIGAPLLLGAGEKIGRAAWVGLLFGLVAIAVLVGPELQLGQLAGLAAALGTAASALAHITLRKLAATDRPTVLVFWFQLSLVPLGLAAHILTQGSLPSLPGPELAAPILVAALAAIGGQWLMTFAYTLERAAPVAAMSYAGPVWAVIIDVLYFDTPPGHSFWIGALLLGLAGYLVVQDSLRHR